MTNKRTLGGVPCSARFEFFMDDCEKCQGTVFYVNDREISNSCRCLRLTPKRKGPAHVANTADLIDALGVLFDDEVDPDKPEGTNAPGVSV